ADEVDEPVARPHRPRVNPVVVGDVCELLGRDVHYGDVGVHRAVVVLAPVDLSLAVDGELCAVGGKRSAYTHVGADIPLDSAIDGYGVKLWHEVVASIG